MTISDFDKIVEEQKKYYSDFSNVISFDEFDKAIEKNRDLLDFLGDKASNSPIISTANGKTHLLSAEFLISAKKHYKVYQLAADLVVFLMQIHL